ncbi:MAG TPA: c-type cytochrome biogenesis protein CcmI [Stellaceae bacterium]|nr:c-type cytochrome biogenesis protein CcmI [Stellaceae bacterium]
MSMGLALGLLALTTLAVALLLAPLILRGRAGQGRDAYNLAVYRDQLAELERDVERGILAPAEAEAAKSEIGRRILALAPGSAEAASARAPLILAGAAILLLPFAAWTLYWQLGSPGVADQPLATRAAGSVNTAGNGAPHLDMEEAVRQLTARLQAHPDDLQGWVLLARSDIDLNRYQEAADAYRHAADLSGRKPEIVGDWAEAQVLAAGGTVTAPAKEAFQAALADPESAPRSRYYLGLAKAQAGDAKGALQDWVDLEADSPADADWLPLLHRRIGETAQAAGIDPAALKTSAGQPRKPPPAQAATPPASPSAEAAMPSPAQVAEAAKATEGASLQDREAMVNTMVERLAERLKQNPDDSDGWSRLGRSYMVLNQPDKAAEAYARAASLKPGDAALKQQYAEALIEARPGDDLPPKATALLREVLAADPKNPEALWYVGVAEADAGHGAAARELWTRLLAQLPADAPVRKRVEDRIAALKGDTPK